MCLRVIIHRTKGKLLFSASYSEIVVWNSVPEKHQQINVSALLVNVSIVKKAKQEKESLYNYGSTERKLPFLGRSAIESQVLDRPLTVLRPWTQKSIGLFLITGQFFVKPRKQTTAHSYTYTRTRV